MGKDSEYKDPMTRLDMDLCPVLRKAYILKSSYIDLIIQEKYKYTNLDYLPMAAGQESYPRT